MKLEKILTRVLSDEINKTTEDLSDFMSLEKIREKVSESVAMKIRFEINPE